MHRGARVADKAHGMPLWDASTSQAGHNRDAGRMKGQVRQVDASKKPTPLFGRPIRHIQGGPPSLRTKALNQGQQFGGQGSGVWSSTFLDEVDGPGSFVDVAQLDDGLSKAAASGHGDFKGRAHPCRPIRQGVADPHFLDDVYFRFFSGSCFDQAKSTCWVGRDEPTPHGLTHNKAECFEVVDRRVAPTGIDTPGLGSLPPGDEVLAVDVGHMHRQIQPQLVEVDHPRPPRGFISSQRLLPICVAPLKKLQNPELPAALTTYFADREFLEGLLRALLSGLACLGRDRVPKAGAAFVPLVPLPVLDEPERALFALDEAGHGSDLPTSHHAACALPTETGKRRHAENNLSNHRSDVTMKPVERVLGMAVELLGGAEKIRRPIVIQCHTDGPLVADKSRILRPFSMILAVPTETRVRFPSPAPLRNQRLMRQSSKSAVNSSRRRPTSSSFGNSRFLAIP